MTIPVFKTGTLRDVVDDWNDAYGGHLDNYGIDAIAARLTDEFIVIPRTDLPEVTERGGEVWAGILSRDAKADPAEVRAHALRVLALAEYLDAHPAAPPVDEAEVDALAWLLASDVLLTTNQAYSDVARRLLATGRIYLAKEA